MIVLLSATKCRACTNEIGHSVMRLGLLLLFMGLTFAVAFGTSIACARQSQVQAQTQTQQAQQVAAVATVNGQPVTKFNDGNRTTCYVLAFPVFFRNGYTMDSNTHYTMSCVGN